MKQCNDKTHSEGALNGFMRPCLGFLVFVSWFYLRLPCGTWGREGGCTLGGQLCAALTGCVRLDSSYLATLVRAHVCLPGAYLLLVSMFSS